MPKPVAGGQEIGGSTASAAEPMTEASHKPALVLDADQTMPGPSFARPAVRGGPEQMALSADVLGRSAVRPKPMGGNQPEAVLSVAEPSAGARPSRGSSDE